MKVIPVFGSMPVSDISQNLVAPVEVRQAAKDWIKGTQGKGWVLIGGLAFAFYSRPRLTTDMGVLFLTADVPEVDGFKRVRKGAELHKDTHVEVETVTPQSINLPQSVAQMVFSTAVSVHGYKVASLEAMVVLKLYAADNQKRRHRDMGDIIEMLTHNATFTKERLTGWTLQDHRIARFEECYNDAHS